MHSRIIGTALLVTVALSLLARPTSVAGDEWISVRSPNFTVVGNASEAQIRRVAMKLEQFRTAFVGLFSMARVDMPVPTRVLVFRSDASFEPFKPVQHGGATNLRGFLLHNPDIDYIALTTQGLEAPSSVIYHEYVHALTRNNSTHAPLWFVEGLAEYYSTFEAHDDGKKIILGKAIPNHVHFLRGRDLIPLRTLFSIDKNSTFYGEAEKTGLFYAQSWALIHYLMQAEAGGHRDGFEKYMTLTANGVGYSESITRAFNTDLPALEGELRRYIARNKYSFDELTLTRNLVVPSEINALPLSDAEMRFYLGDVLLHQNRLDEASPYLEQAVALDGKLASARASLGMLRAKQKRFVEAREQLALATASPDSGDPLAYYYYSYALSRELMPTDTTMTKPSPAIAGLMRTQLRRSIELAPRFAEALRLLAVVEFVVGENIDEAERAIRRALAVSPDEGEYIYLLAQILMREMRLIEARNLLHKLVTTPVQENVRAKAVELLDKVDVEIATNPHVKR